MNYIDFDDMDLLKIYKSMRAHLRFKTVNVLFTRMLEQKMKEENVQGSSYSLHPGVVSTDIWSNFREIYMLTKCLMLPIRLIIFQTEWEGVQATLYVALEKSVNMQGGEYCEDCKMMKFRLSIYR
jgi:hypothetical protein